MIKLLNNLLKLHENNDMDGKKEIINDICRKYSFWASEAFEILHLFRDQLSFVDMASILMPKIRDP